MMVTVPSVSDLWMAAVPDWFQEENVYMIDNWIFDKDCPFKTLKDKCINN